MRASLPDIYGETITLINKLDANHAALKEDVYYTTVIHGCMWSTESAIGTSSSGVVTPTTLHRVQIPSDAGDYESYTDWRKLDSREGIFTLRANDYVVRGEVTEPITAANIRNVVRDYEPDAFQVRAWRELTIPDSNVRKVAGLPLYAFYLEG